MSLLGGSAAINAGSNAAANTAGLTTDQRGLARVVGGTADIGAFEVQPPPLHPPAPQPRPALPNRLIASLLKLRRRNKTILQIVLTDATTGVVKAQFASPFQQSVYRNIVATVVDNNGAGDAVQVMV